MCTDRRTRRHGPNRRAMGHSGAALPEASHASRSTRPTLARSARRVERHSLDPAHRSAVEGLARALSVVSDLSSALSALGARRDTPSRPQGARRGSARPRRARPQRNLHRWLLCQRQKKGRHVGKTKRGKGTKIMAIADRAGLPVAITIASASPHETQLVEQTLNASFLPDHPERLIGDAAYDSDGLDQTLAACGIELIAPHRPNRVNLTQDRRPLRRYKRRWKVERLFAWLQNSRRLVTRYERRAANFTGFLHLACAMILLRHL